MLSSVYLQIYSIGCLGDASVLDVVYDQQCWRAALAPSLIGFWVCVSLWLSLGGLLTTHKYVDASQQIVYRTPPRHSTLLCAIYGWANGVCTRAIIIRREIQCSPSLPLNQRTLHSMDRRGLLHICVPIISKYGKVHCMRRDAAQPKTEVLRTYGPLRETPLDGYSKPT